MAENKLFNQPCYDKNGKPLGYFSRSMAVAVFIFRIIDNKIEVLLEKRGKGAADNVGKYCCVCGYLDFNETLEEACAREALEETGFEIKTNKLKYVFTNSDPSENNQNVTAHYIYFADKNEDFNIKNAKGGEKDEIETVEWFEIGEISNDHTTLKIDIYKLYEKGFAFNHELRIIEHLAKFYNLNYL